MVGKYGVFDKYGLIDFIAIEMLFVLWGLLCCLESLANIIHGKKRRAKVEKIW